MAGEKNVRPQAPGRGSPVAEKPRPVMLPDGPFRLGYQTDSEPVRSPVNMPIDPTFPKTAGLARDLSRYSADRRFPRIHEETRARYCSTETDILWRGQSIRSPAESRDK